MEFIKNTRSRIPAKSITFSGITHLVSTHTCEKRGLQEGVNYTSTWLFNSVQTEDNEYVFEIMSKDNFAASSNK